MKLSFLLPLFLVLLSPLAIGQPNVKERTPGTMIRISGVVDDVPLPNSFELDYGDGEILVEFDDWDPEPDAYKVKKGDEVIVTGRLDDDFMHGKTLEAGSVYVTDIEETYYANPKDEEEPFANMSKDMEKLSTVVQGKVVSTTDQKFILKSSNQEIQIDVSGITNNIKQSDIKAGDVVRVAGRLQRSFFNDREINAVAVIRQPD